MPFYAYWHPMQMHATIVAAVAVAVDVVDVAAAAVASAFCFYSTHCRVISENYLCRFPQNTQRKKRKDIHTETHTYTHKHTHSHTVLPSWGIKKVRLQLRVACNYRSDRRTAINVYCRCLPQVRGTKKGDKWPLDGASRLSNALACLTSTDSISTVSNEVIRNISS